MYEFFSTINASLILDTYSINTFKTILRTKFIQHHSILENQYHSHYIYIHEILKIFPNNEKLILLTIAMCFNLMDSSCHCAIHLEVTNCTMNIVNSQENFLHTYLQSRSTVLHLLLRMCMLKLVSSL